MSKPVISGVGLRHGHIFPLDSDGLPSCNVASAVPVQGSLISGIQGLAMTDPDPQRITHYGDDYAYAQDSLPATTVGSFNITTSKTDLVIDSMIEGNKVRAIDSLQLRGANTDKKGQEPQMCAIFYRQALDTQVGDAQFGKLRQWHVKIFPSVRITPKGQSFEQGATQKTYAATPTPVTVTPWNEIINEVNWGANFAEYIEMITDYQPRFNIFRGDGTITARQLSHQPVSSGYLHVMVDGTLTTPITVNTGANPSYTLGAATAMGKKEVVIIETVIPGTT